MADKNAARYKQNFNALVSQGVDANWLQSKTGGAVETKAMDSLRSTYQKEGDTKKMETLASKTPDFLKNDPAFQNLPYDLKEIAIYNYEVQKANNTQKVQTLSQALEQATIQADPYWKQIIRIAQTEVQNGLSDIQGDFASQNDRLKRQIQAMNEDLETNKTNLTLDQQSQIASLVADLTDRQKTFELNMNQLGAKRASQLDALELDYRKNVDDIQKNISYTVEEKATALDKINRDFTANRGQIIGSAAEAGLTFSTKRKIAEQRLNEENRGVVESTIRTYNKQLSDLVSANEYSTQQYGMQKENIAKDFQFSTEQQKQAYDTSQRQIQEERDRVQRQYAQQIAELETEAARGNTEAQAQLTDLQRKLQSSLASASLSAEKYLGTENMPAGAQTLGGVTGSFYEDKARDIAQRQQSLFGEMTQASLNF